ncbi:MAG: phenylalanine--tRNA ligase beta subunit-related protein [Burkholderiaceae bacterium]
MQYLIDAEVFESYPGYRRGVVVIRGAQNTRDGSALETLLRSEEARVRERLAGINVAEHPAIAAWRDAYRRFGAKPSEHRSSIEAMLRRVLKPDRLPSINPLVDIGNIVSLRYLLPAGVHPLPAGGPGLALRRAREGDTFLPADGAAPEAPPATEVVFAHGAEILTRRWTWRQAAGTQTLPDTTEVFFNIDGLPPVDDDAVRLAMTDIAQLVVAHTGGSVIAMAVLAAGASCMRMEG